LPSSSSPPVISLRRARLARTTAQQVGFTKRRAGDPPEKASPYIIRDVGLIGETAGNRSLLMRHHKKRERIDS
jgi:hypothetical protein